MVMTMTGDVDLQAPRETIWFKLNDPEVLKLCIPGCEELDMVSPTEFTAVVTNKIGPVKARFRGRVELTDIELLVGYTISGKGEGGIAGFAKGGASVRLADTARGTMLSYNVEAEVGGKIAQLGQRLINSTAMKLADEFFVRFGAVCEEAAAELVDEVTVRVTSPA